MILKNILQHILQHIFAIKVNCCDREKNLEIIKTYEDKKMNNKIN